MLAEACVTDSLAATTDMEAEASATAADAMAAVTTAADTTAADTMAATTVADTTADSQAVEHLAAAAHAPLQEQMAAVVADSVAAVQAVPALQAPRLPLAATPAPHSALQ